MPALRRIIYLLVCLFILMPSLLAAETVTVAATGEYIMGDNDTFTEGKRLALQDAKRLVLEKTGTYIEGVTEVKNGAISSDVIKQYTAGIVKIEVLDEQRQLLASKATAIKVNVRATIDPQAIVKQVMALQNRKELEEKARTMTDENDRLKKEITLLNQQIRAVVDETKDQELRARRNEALKKILDNEAGLTLLVSGDSLVSASLMSKRNKEDDLQFIAAFLKEVLAAYQIAVDEPEVEDNGNGTSNVTIRYTLKLPGRFDLYKSRIDVPTIDAFLAKGFVIRSFSNGGLLIKCADSRNRRCHKTLLPFFEEEVKRIRMVIRLGSYVNTAKVGLSESYGSSKSGSASPPLRTPSSTPSKPGRYEPPIERPAKKVPSDGSLYYPLVNKGNYTSVFQNISHQELQKVSAIEIKFQYE